MKKELDLNLCSAYLDGTATNEESNMIMMQMLEDPDFILDLNMAACVMDIES